MLWNFDKQSVMPQERDVCNLLIGCIFSQHFFACFLTTTLNNAASVSLWLGGPRPTPPPNPSQPPPPPRVIVQNHLEESLLDQA